MLPNRKKLAAFGLVILILLGLQLFQPDEPGPMLPGDGLMTDHVTVPEDVNVLLWEACYDCHSGETRWPWYSRISPLSWIIVKDVRHGRSDLDFSQWSTDPDLEPTPVQRLTWMCKDIREGKMPPLLYRLAHPKARLSEEAMETICTWTTRARLALDTDSLQSR